MWRGGRAGIRALKAGTTLMFLFKALPEMAFSRESSEGGISLSSVPPRGQWEWGTCAKAYFVVDVI